MIPFVRKSPKVGQNAPCPCGSGKKYKKCHGFVAVQPRSMSPGLPASHDLKKEIERKLRARQAQEAQRQKQQGLGRPIISTEFQGQRLVAIGKELHWGKWTTVTDFLHAYLKSQFGQKWADTELLKAPEARHPVMQWAYQIFEEQEKHGVKPGVVSSMPISGASSAFFRLAYNLYLIAHNGNDIKTNLIGRLKNTEGFQGAFYETQVAAWLIKSGFELEFEDESDRSSSHCEFTATYTQTGDKYSVEAKSRSPQPGSTSSKKIEVGHRLLQALAKNANHPRLIFLDLFHPIQSEDEAIRKLAFAENLMRRAEPLTIKGLPTPPAFVCLTSVSDQFDTTSHRLGLAVKFCGFKIPDFMNGKPATLREVIENRKKYLPLCRLLESMGFHRNIPATFNGEFPSDVFSKNQPTRIRVGDLYVVPGPSGALVSARVTTAIARHGKALCAFHDEASDEAWFAEMPMSSEQLRDYEESPRTYFGEITGPDRPAETALDLYDFFHESFKRSSKEILLSNLKDAPDIEALRQLTQTQLADICAERTTNAAWAQSHNRAPPSANPNSAS